MYKGIGYVYEVYMRFMYRYVYEVHNRNQAISQYTKMLLSC